MKRQAMMNAAKMEASGDELGGVIDALLTAGEKLKK